MINTLATTLAAINLLAWCMVKLRPRLYGAKLYKPMLLNIKLSIAPLLVLGGALFLVILLQMLPGLWWLSVCVLAVGFILWLLLLPNAGYLITELNFNHRDHDKVQVPLWYDIVSVLTLAMSGVMNMCFNIFLVQFILTVVLGTLFFTGPWFWGAGWALTILLIALASFGIYLGRYIRFNSWDIRHPKKFLQKLQSHFAEKGSGKNCALFTLFHSLFFFLFYRATVGVVEQELIASISFVT